MTKATPKRLEHTASVVYLSDDAAAASGPNKKGDTPPVSAPLCVAVSIRRGRLVLLATLATTLIISIVLALHQGVELLQFEASTKNATDREKLLDKYNAYSGNVASAVGKPIEIFVAVLAQLISLRFMAHAYTQPYISWRQLSMPLAISAGIGYLISNGFNAINVQLHAKKIKSVILTSDLSVPSTLSETVAMQTTTVANTVSEMRPQNLVSNTVLRNAVLPRVTFKQTLCAWEQTRFENTMRGDVPVPTIDYGFTQRDWQSRLLQTALPAETLEIIVNPTNKTNITKPSSGALPMNASLAADLFLYAMTVGPTVFPWGGFADFVDQKARRKRYPEGTPEEVMAAFVERSAVVTGLLPPSNVTTSELEQRDWFLQAVPSAIARQFNNSVNTSRKDIGVTFSHVEISPSIDFDAVSLTVELDPKLLATATSRDKATRYTQLYQAGPPGQLSDCGPWPALCLVRRPLYQAKPEVSAPDAVQQIHAFSACASPDDNVLMSKTYGDAMFTCNESSNSSFMIMSVGKRLVADSFVQNKTDNVTGDGVVRSALVTNLRKIYTFTIGRLSWRLENLAQAFGADCGAGQCRGLQVPLSSSTLSELGLVARDKNKPQRLVVNADALPTTQIMPSTLLHIFKPRAVPLVDVTEPAVINSDVLLLHNIGEVVWANETVRDDCDADFESLLYSKLNNHMYIEHGFQAAYTAGTFFLLQNAVVKDVVPNTQAVTLNFAGNTQAISAVVSTPLQNLVLTIVGCALLMLCVLWVVGKTSFITNETDPLAKITAPQAIARVMMDNDQFPPFLLHRRVVGDRGEELQRRSLDTFTIAQLVVEHENKTNEREDTEDTDKGGAERTVV